MAENPINVRNVNPKTEIVAHRPFVLEEGKVQKIDFHEGEWQSIDEFFECVVVKSKDDYVWPFFEQSIPVLEAPFQDTIEEVMEAFLFKELYEVRM